MKLLSSQLRFAMWKVGQGCLLFVDPENSAWEFNAKSKKKIMEGIVDVASCGSDSLFLDSEGVVWRKSSQMVLDRIPDLPEIKSIYGGDVGSMMFLDTNGFVWCWGVNNNNNLGIVNYSPEKPIKNPFLSNIVSVAVSKHHSLFLTDEGRVWGCGYNCEGQLGLGEHRGGLQREPVLIENLPVIDKIAAGYHSMFLDFEGSVWVCGWNYYGELGLKHKKTIYTPIKVVDLPVIVEISAGYLHSLFLDIDGKVWSCGMNNSGQLGREISPELPQIIEDIPLIAEIEGSQTTSHFIDQDGRLWVCGEPTFQPVLVEEFSSSIMPRKQRKRKQVKSARNVASVS